MATDYGKLTRNLGRFYDFTDKIVIFVGAGGRQLLDRSVRTSKLIAIDQDTEALKELQSKVAAEGTRDCIEVVASRFEDVRLSGDVVYFEFCLHEMDDPGKALAHARALAPDLVVFDHSPGSGWAYYAAEEDKVHRSSEAMRQFGVRRRRTYLTEQRFRDHAELLAKVRGQGSVAIERAQRFAGATDISIPMSYELALL